MRRAFLRIPGVAARARLHCRAGRRGQERRAGQRPPPVRRARGVRRERNAVARCSASLLTPTLVLTAGHCTDGTSAARIWFAESAQMNPEYPFSGATSFDGVAHTYPDFCIGCGNGLPGFAFRDVGVIVLTEPVPTSVVSTYASLPTAGLVDTLESKADVDLVGYGVSVDLRGRGRSDRSARTPVRADAASSRASSSMRTSSSG